VLERDELGEELGERLGDRVDRLREALAGEPPADVEAFLRRMPRAYLLAIEPSRSARHFATIVPPVGAIEVRAVHLEGLRPGTYELLVVAQDRPGLLSWIAGSLALAGLSIHTAQVFTTEDGVAVDVFEVEGVWEHEVGERRWREFRTTLRRAIEGSLSLEHLVEEKRRWYPPPAADVPVTVAVQNDASDFATVIEVGAPDRLGLLYDLTRTLADEGVDVHLAKVATYDGRVIDAFYVRDGLGRKLEDTATAARLDAALRSRLGA
jgi:[protein-PII] uridylyltransferase